MNLKVWREAMAQGSQFTLPSGLVVTLRRVSIFDLAAQGEIPDNLTSQVNEMIRKGTRDVTLSDFAKFEGLIDIGVKAAMLDPAVGDEPAGDTLGIHELPMLDRIAVFNWANETAQALRPFRLKPAGAVDTA